MPLSLSGYLPGEEGTGLKDLAADLIAEFHRQRAEKGEVTKVLTVVGHLRVQSCKDDRDPEKEASVEVRFAALEVAPEGSEDEQVLSETLRDLRDQRRGELALELESAAGLNDPGEHPGDSTSR